MEVIESTRFVLLFWYDNERNWSIQKTTTIIKPRREPEEYKVGDFVVAKFSGKNYRAAVIGVHETKEELGQRAKELEEALKDKSLMNKDIFEKMGIKVDHCLQQQDNNDIPVAQQSLSTESSDKSKVKAKKPSKPKKVMEKEDKTGQKSTLKQLKRKQTEASIEASKVLAKKLMANTTSLHKSVTSIQYDDEGDKSLAENDIANQESPQMAMVQGQNDEENALLDQGLSQVGVSQGCNNAQNVVNQVSSLMAMAQGQNDIDQGSSQIVVNQGSSQIAMVQGHNHAENYNPTLDKMMSNAFTGYNNNNMKDPAMMRNGSSSNNGFSSNTAQTPLTPLNHQMPENGFQNLCNINETINHVLEANRTLNSFESYGAIRQEHSIDPHLECKKRICYLENQVGQLTEKINFLESALLKEFMDKFAAQAVQNCNHGCSTSTSSRNVTSPPDDVDANLDSSVDADSIPLIDGRPLRIKKIQLDAVKRKSPTATALVRNLLLVYFSNTHLAERCARGSKTRPSLDKDKLDTIIQYVLSLYPDATERNLIQAVNGKCSDLRMTLKLANQANS